jgi:hypothetical protein
LLEVEELSRVEHKQSIPVMLGERRQA